MAERLPFGGHTLHRATVQKQQIRPLFHGIRKHESEPGRPVPFSSLQVADVLLVIELLVDLFDLIAGGKGWALKFRVLDIRSGYEFPP